MSKGKKVFLIILLSLLVSCGIAYIVLYCIYPTNTQKITWDVVDYICNKPLPVIGVSTLVLAFAIFKIVKFIVSNKGKKFSELKIEISQLKLELNAAKEEAEKLKELIYTNHDETCEDIKEVCDAIPNKKVKVIGEKVYGKRTNSNTETEKI